jgi:hypothetical protein
MPGKPVGKKVPSKVVAPPKKNPFGAPSNNFSFDGDSNTSNTNSSLFD